MAPTIEDYTNVLITYLKQFPHALTDFKQSYIFYNNVPSNSEYETIFNQNKSIIEKVNADLFVTTNQIEKSIQDLNSNINSLNSTIQDQKETSQELLSLYNNLSGNQDGKYTLINNTKDLYKFQYITNVNMIVGICILSYMLYSVFKKPSEVAKGF
jgi:TolA-binding protein